MASRSIPGMILALSTPKISGYQTKSIGGCVKMGGVYGSKCMSYERAHSESSQPKVSVALYEWRVLQ